MRHLMLVLLLAVRRCLSPAPFSLIQADISAIYYFGAAMPPKIIPWYNSKANNYFQSLTMNADEVVMFTAVARETIDCLHWSAADNLKHNNNNNLSISLPTFEDRILNLSAENCSCILKGN